VRSVIDRLVDRLAVDERGCWLWTGPTDRGYGRMHYSGRKAICHRLTFEHFREPIPPGLEIDHLCRVRNCVNPWHLEVVSHHENMHRGKAPNILCNHRGRCRRGHSLASAYVHDGKRYCRECGAIRSREYRARRREAAQATKGTAI
jgi:hypothetical protein